MTNSDLKKLKQTITELERRLESAEARSQELREENEILEGRLAGAEAYVARIDEDNRFLRRQITIDGLTGVRNRKFFDEEFPREVLEAKRREETVSVVMIDVDNFKKFNDIYGHQKGDEVLQEVAQVIEKAVKRPTDSLSRYGGEEFVFILPNTDVPGAQYIAEKARRAVESLNIPHSGNDGIVTISLGTATLLPGKSSESASQLLKRADDNLYEAKECGRNRVFCG